MDLVTPELRNTTARSGRYTKTKDKDSNLDKTATYRNLYFYASGDIFNANYDSNNNDNKIGKEVNDNAATKVTDRDNGSEPAKKKARVNISETYNHLYGCSKKIPTGFLS